MDALTEAQRLDLAHAIEVGWHKYTSLFGEPPHGTLPQLLALLELAPLTDLTRGIRNKAIAEWYAEGQGKKQSAETEG